MLPGSVGKVKTGKRKFNKVNEKRDTALVLLVRPQINNVLFHRIVEGREIQISNEQ